MAMTADQLPDDPDALKAMVLARDVENARLIQIIKELQRHRFGRRAETLPEDQLLLGLEEAEQIEAADDEENEQASPAERLERARKRRTNRGALPPHLPRVEMVVDIEDHACPGCRNGLHRIGEDVSERLDIVPAQLRVIVVHRPKYACRACEELIQDDRHTLCRWDPAMKYSCARRYSPLRLRRVISPGLRLSLSDAQVLQRNCLRLTGRTR